MKHLRTSPPKYHQQLTTPISVELVVAALKDAGSHLYISLHVKKQTNKRCSCHHPRPTVVLLLQLLYSNAPFCHLRFDLQLWRLRVAGRHGVISALISNIDWSRH